MSKHLSGSPGTGEKIMKNISLFHYNFIQSEEQGEGEDKTLYKFKWSFDNYHSGIISIIIRSDGTIDESSLIICLQNIRNSSRPLGAYNDSSLYNVFRMLLDSQHISHK